MRGHVLTACLYQQDSRSTVEDDQVGEPEQILPEAACRMLGVRNPALHYVGHPPAFGGELKRTGSRSHLAAR